MVSPGGVLLFAFAEDRSRQRLNPWISPTAGSSTPDCPTDDIRSPPGKTPNALRPRLS